MGEIVYETREYKVSGDPKLLDRLELLFSEIRGIIESGEPKAVTAYVHSENFQDLMFRKDGVRIKGKYSGVLVNLFDDGLE